jgi:carbon-monoxide dehydrogenase small subunit/xanthine dehydrogenase small subunit
MINGEPRAVDAPPERRLLDILREDLGLTGTKEGCGEGECGACAVLLDGELVDSCLIPALQVAGRSVLTIEGLGTEESPDRVQRAFLEEGAVQCGICIPGMVLASYALLERNPRPQREEIRLALAGNLCRCTGYERIIRAVERASRMERRPAQAAVSVQGTVTTDEAQASADHATLEARSPVRPPAKMESSRTHPDALCDGSLADALRALAARKGDLVPIAGGTDLMTAIRLGPPAPAELLDLSAYPELREVGTRDGILVIGAAVTLTRILEDPLIARHAPALRQSAEVFGAPAIRNRATLGGNLMSASPAADLPPVLLALDAAAIFVSATGERRVPLAELYLGYRRTARQPGEILHSVRVPLASRAARQGFYKVGTRRAQSIAKVSLGGWIELGRNRKIRSVRLAAGSVAPTPMLLRETAAWLDARRLAPELPAQAEAIAAAEVRPIDDVRSTAEYRRVVTGRLVRRFLEDQLGTT